MRRLLVRSLMMAAVAGGLGALADAPAAAQVSTLDAQNASWNGSTKTRGGAASIQA